LSLLRQLRPPTSTLFPYTTALPIYRTPSILFLTTETNLLNTFPEMRSAFLPQFPGRIDWSPAYCENMLVWLLSLNIWANNRLLRSEEHTSELQSRGHLVCRLLLEKK